jgi:hypothetical protein
MNSLTKVSFFAVVVTLATLIGCEKLYYDEADLVLTTDRSSYSRGDTIKVSIENPLEFSVYLRRCGAQSFRYAIYEVDSRQTDPFRIDQCSSFNQSRVEIPRRGRLDIAFLLSYSLSIQANEAALYSIHFSISDVQSVEPSKIPAITNPFRIVPRSVTSQ